MEADGRFSLTHSPASTWELNACPGARLEKRSALFIWGGSKLQKKNIEPRSLSHNGLDKTNNVICPKRGALFRKKNE